ncbi:MAG TPA: sigma-70 family RNA polymerase sigma factor [Caulobacteraceae bacterium]|nr:sigma-70 family RNA polymerase sigma factor [Caulobacteraceae bacterium]
MATLEQVLADYGPALARIASSYERDRSLRDELVQEIAVAVWRSLPNLQDPARLRPFVFRIAHNRAVSHVARQAGRPRQDELSERLADAGPDPEASLLARERSDRLVEAVRRLPLPYRQVITLVLEDLSYDEIGEALGLTSTNVGVRINRARAQLKAMLA